MRIVLVFQCGIANVFKVDRFSAIPQRRGNVVRLYQGDFRSAEMMAMGMGYAGGTRPDRPLRPGGRRGRRDLGRRPRQHVQPRHAVVVRLTGPLESTTREQSPRVSCLRPPGGPAAEPGRRPARGRSPRRPAAALGSPTAAGRPAPGPRFPAMW